MKTLLSLLLLTFSVASHAQNKPDQEPYLTKTFNEAVKSVEAETSGGNIAVSGAASEARVEVYVRSNNNRGGDERLSKEEIKSRLDADYDLDVSVHNGTITAKARPKRRNMDWKKSLSISFRIFVPQTVATDLTTSGGNIDLTNLSGNQKFTTSGGNLRLNGISGKTRGMTSGGNVYVKNSKDDINLTTSGGNIEATDCTGHLNLSTSGGNVKLSRLNGDIDATTSGGNVQGETIDGALSAHTSGGNIQLDDLTCRLETSTSGGHINVAIKKLNKSIKISNSGGNISLQLPKGSGADLDLQGRKVENIKLESFSGSVEDDQIRGKINGGGALVMVNAGSGRVSLSFQ